MEDLYTIHPVISREVEQPTDLSDLLKLQIASHPRYPSLVSAYIDCRKVGAPPEVATLLEEITVREGRQATTAAVSAAGVIGADPELDEFMDSYCKVLKSYREELLRSFDEAATFLSEIETQLSRLCSNGNGNGDSSSTTTTTTTTTTTNNPVASSLCDEAAGTSEEELSCVDAEPSEGQECGSRLGDHDLKDLLLKKYSGYLSSLRTEFLKKRKKGKLPRDARMTLLNWWNSHYRWPYPTDEEKVKLANVTGLNQKQINNWFINQRKRHWKPSEDMRFALMEGVGGGSSGTTTLYFDTGTVGP